MATDEKLYAKGRAGDARAFDELYARYEKPLYRFLYEYLRNAQDAEDVFHETWIALLRSRELDFSQGTFKAWVYRVARNQALNRLRGGRRLEAMRRALPERDPVMPPEPSREVALAESLAELPPTLAALFEMRARGLSYDEMAVELGVPVGTVKSRLHEMVRRLKERMRS
jgi:RNA polymerase sigma-70 factor (ECF subfamily)